MPLLVLLVVFVALAVACGGGSERPAPEPAAGAGPVPAEPRGKTATPTRKSADPAPAPISPAAAWLADLERRQREESAAAKKTWQDQIDTARVEFVRLQLDYVLSVSMQSLHVQQLAARSKAIEAAHRLVRLQENPPKTHDRKLYSDRLGLIPAGDFGYVPRDVGEVAQVVGPDEVLLKMQSGELVWFGGISGVVDKSVVVISGVVENTGPRSYATVLGANRTVNSYRRHDGELPWFPIITPQTPDLTGLPPLPQPKAAPKKK